jgi:hypothetical protein
LGSLKAEWGLLDVWGLGVTDFPRPLYLHRCGSKTQKINRKCNERKIQTLEKRKENIKKINAEFAILLLCVSVLPPRRCASTSCKWNVAGCRHIVTARKIYLATY